MASIGNLLRVFTTLAVTGDALLLVGFSVGSLINLVRNAWLDKSPLPLCVRVCVFFRVVFLASERLCVFAIEDSAGANDRVLEQP